MVRLAVPEADMVKAGIRSNIKGGESHTGNFSSKSDPPLSVQLYEPVKATVVVTFGWLDTSRSRAGGYTLMKKFTVVGCISTVTLSVCPAGGPEQSNSAFPRLKS